jgi:hypothetical protein
MEPDPAVCLHPVVSANLTEPFDEQEHVMIVAALPAKARLAADDLSILDGIAAVEPANDTPLPFDPAR